MIKQLIAFAMILYIPLAIKLSSYLLYKPMPVIKTHVRRADIVDSSGVLLATTIPTQSVYIVPHEVLERDKIVDDLSAILNVDRQKIDAKSTRIF